MDKSAGKKRIYGLENEYGITCVSSGHRRLSPDEVARYLFRKVVSWGRSSNVFLTNGGRLYLDVGSHPEFATPECLTPSDAVLFDKAGERIVEDLRVAAQKRIEEEGISGQIHIFKNNTDSVGNSYGCHENYSTDRQDDFIAIGEGLVPFLVTRQIFAGAGKLTNGPSGPKFLISQRAEHIWEGVSSATTRSRPIINSRDEPHGDAERFRRLHVIVGDSNLNEYSSVLKLSSTGLVCRVLEEMPELLSGIALNNPTKAIRDVAGVLTCRGLVELEDGTSISAIDLQFRYLNAVKIFAQTHYMEDHEQEGLQNWEQILNLLETDPRSAHRECDWVLKLNMLEGLAKKNGTELDDPRAQLIDLSYHDIDQSRGLYYRAQAAQKVRRVFDDSMIDEAKENPPQKTRAKLRSDFIKAAKEKRRDYTVDWVHLKINDTSQRTVLCKDPFKYEDSRVTKLIEDL